jgi:hypothetical protein
MFEGYALDHAGDCFQMYDVETKRVHLSRDVVWLRRMYFENTTTQIDDPFTIELESTTSPTLEAGKGISTERNSTEVGSGSQDPMTFTRFNRTVQAPQRLIEEAGTVSYEIRLTSAEEKYYEAIKTCPEEYPSETAFVGAAIGGGFTNTSELHVQKYNDAMNTSDPKERKEVETAIEEEHERMVKNKVFKTVPRSSVDAKDIITSTWSIKKTSDGTPVADYTDCICPCNHGEVVYGSARYKGSISAWRVRRQ